MANIMPTPPSSSPALAERTNLILPVADPALQAELDRLKADLEALRVIAANKSRRGRKRKRSNDPPPSSDDNDGASSGPSTNEPPDFHQAGRILARHIGSGVFDDFGAVIRYGLNRDTGLEDDDLGLGPLEESIDQKRMGEVYALFWQQNPGVHTLVLKNFHDFHFLNSLSGSVNGGIESVRSDDSATLRNLIGQLILVPPLASPDNTTNTADSIPVDYTSFNNFLQPEAAAASNKDLRGFNDIYYGSLLLPLEYKDNPDFPNPVNGVRSGAYLLDGAMPPSFLYPFGQKNDTTALRNFLASPILLRALKAILQGPSSALKSDGFHAGRKAVAKIINLRTVTPRVIAYGACQVRFALSSMQAWNRWDGNFDYEKFFWMIVTELDKPNLASRTIKMYNQAIFGNPAGRDAPNEAPTTSPLPTMSNMERLRAQARDNGEDDDPE
ncbi:hypothetical protein C8F01DRAFT_554380 [Mycena amicta]|nr:hypothetical protein C8F01DRAFT_554380 [Mycena amicta]